MKRMPIPDNERTEIMRELKREQTRRWLIGILQDCRMRAQDGLADIPEDGREYARRKQAIDFCTITLRRIGA